MSRVTLVALSVWSCLHGVAAAHHSVGINFDNTKAFPLTGVLKELDIRNPHSQITLAVTGSDGSVVGAPSLICCPTTRPIGTPARAHAVCVSPEQSYESGPSPPHR